MTTGSKTITVVDIKDDDDSINDEQLSEYDEMLEELGSFPVCSFSEWFCFIRFNTYFLFLTPNFFSLFLSSFVEYPIG
jgi:hypothetical protein